MTRYARVERAALAELLLQVGPGAPTLCEGWAARDLAAHIVIRERRPFAAAGIAIKSLSGRTARIQAQVAQTTDYPSLVRDLSQPPAWSLLSNPLFDEALNINEMFIHHEDLRRAQPGWSVRVLAPEMETELFKRVRRTARLMLRKLPLNVTLVAPGHGELTAGGGGPAVTVTAPPSELALFLYGRQAVAKVEITGDAAGAQRLRHARLGL